MQTSMSILLYYDPSLNSDKCYHPIPSHPSHPIPFHPIPSHPIPSHPIPFHSIPTHPIALHPSHTCSEQEYEYKQIRVAAPSIDYEFIYFLSSRKLLLEWIITWIRTHVHTRAGTYTSTNIHERVHTRVGTHLNFKAPSMILISSICSGKRPPNDNKIRNKIFEINKKYEVLTKKWKLNFLPGNFSTNLLFFRLQIFKSFSQYAEFAFFSIYVIMYW